MSTDEREVMLTGLSDKDAVSLLQAEQVERTAEEVAQATPKFVESNYASFRAEHAFISGDLVIHFFLPQAAGDLRKVDAITQRTWETYWLTTFPDQLSSVAQEYFRADKPRLMAKYTEELASWWFRARRFGDVLDPEGLARGFYDKLDESLRALGS